MEKDEQEVKGDWVEVMVEGDYDDGKKYSFEYEVFLTNWDMGLPHLDGVVGISPGLKNHDPQSFAKKIAMFFSNNLYPDAFIHSI